MFSMIAFTLRIVVCVSSFALAAGCGNGGSSGTADSASVDNGLIEIPMADGVRVYGSPHQGGLDASAPLIHLFHQGGSNGAGEYGSLIGWLNENGFRAIAWDARAGGDTFGGENRTQATVTDQPSDYCDAYGDVEAAIKRGETIAGDAPVIVWGSSYSGALVFQAAAKNPDLIDAIIAFSPASGGPLADCRAIQYINGVTAPALVLRPASEMERESAQNQRAILEAAGVRVEVFEHGVHGSSMLVDDRTGHDMSEARDIVIDWLKEQTEEN
ncbi:MAG: alpha/beta fold hydrolase [Pseudomonadota bacterium]